MYAHAIENVEKPEDRDRLERLVTVRRVTRISDPDLPPELQGMEPPEWWDEEDPFADTWDLPDGDDE